MFVLRQLLVYLLLFVVAVTVYEFIRIRLLVSQSQQLIASASPYSNSPRDPAQRILVVGDSTGVGTGTSDTRFSLAGRLGEQFPAGQVVNESANGLRTADLLALVKEQGYQDFDLVVVHAGGNDIIHFDNLTQAAANLRQAVDILAGRNRQIAVFTTGDMGDSDFFPILAKPLMTARSRSLRDKVKSIASEYQNVAYVDLFSKEGNLKTVDGYAADKLHLSDSGYALWYEALKETLRGTSFEL